jgi:hypothetical protein
MKNLKCFVFWGFFLLLVLSFQTSYALTNYMFFSINGDTGLSSMVQGDTLSWGANCAIGAQTHWQIWIDLDQDSILDNPGDKLLFEFSIADGDTSNKDAPGDISPVPDGWYICQPIEPGIAPTHYIFKMIDLTDSTTVQRGLWSNPLPSPPNKFTGWITLSGHSAPDATLKNIWVEADDSISESAFWAGLSNDSGYYEINVGSSGTERSFYIKPSDVAGYITPAEKTEIASGVVDSVNFSYESPADSIFGEIKDQDDSLLALNLSIWCSPRFSGPSYKNYESTDGRYKIFFGSSDLGSWDMGLNSDNLAPDYLVPNSFQFNNQTQHSIEHDFTCQKTDTTIHGSVTESGGLPTHSYRIRAESNTLQSYTETVSGTGSNNNFVLHVSSLDSSHWCVNVNELDDDYPIPTGYVLEGGGNCNFSPGDMVLLNFISGKVVRDTIKVDSPDPGIVWDSVWVYLSATGKNYGANPGSNGVYTIYADSGTYNMMVYCANYLSIPNSRAVVISSDTSGGLGFTLNHAHAHIQGTLSNVSLPIDSGYYVSAETEAWPNGYHTSAEINGTTGTFNLYVCDGSWTFYPPSIPNYSSSSSQSLTISETPDTLRTISFSYLGVNDDKGTKALPKNFALEQNYPNPFNQSTELKYYVPERAKSAFVSLRIYNLLGQRIRTLINENRSAGSYSIIWDGKNDNRQTVSSGVYFYRIEAGNFVQTKKMLLLK